MKTLILFLVPFLLATFLSSPLHAQGREQVYTVQIGDTLTQIALKYNVSIARLTALNDIDNPNVIVAGQQLVIPTDSGSPPANILTAAAQEQTYTIKSGDTLYVIATRFGVTLSDLAAANNITDVDVIQVGEDLVIPGRTIAKESEILPAPFVSITLSESIIAQGRTLVVYITLSKEADVSARFEDRPVYLTGDGLNYWGIVGIHALQEVGLYSVAVNATLADGQEGAIAKNVQVIAGPYGTETIQVVPGRENLLSPEVIRAEAQKVWAIWSQVTPYPLWDDAFWYPVSDVRLTSTFGTRRSYGGGPANSFHAGTDFGAGVGIPIYAPAAGIVVMAEPLDVRGNAVLIDHGMGLFSGYWHQTEIVVQLGQQVQRGDLIGYVGDTGLVTGAHLHWEMRLGGIAVEPLQWVQESIP